VQLILKASLADEGIGLSRLPKVIVELVEARVKKVVDGKLNTDFEG
jgi:hypothetical protein